MNNIWHTNPNHPPDEYMCIVNLNTDLVLHTLHPETVGNNVAHNKLLGSKKFPSCTLGDIPEFTMEYVGEYISSSEERQIAAFMSVPERNWVIGIQHSEEKLKTRSKIRYATCNSGISF